MNILPDKNTIVVGVGLLLAASTFFASGYLLANHNHKQRLTN